MHTSNLCAVVLILFLEESSRHYKDVDALINEEAILNIMENSQHFQLSSQSLNKNPICSK